VTPAGAFPGLDSPGRISGTVIAGLIIEAAMVWRFGWRSPLGAYSFLAATGAVLSAADFAARRVPNLIVLPAFPIATVLLVVASAPSGWWWPLARAGITAAGLGGFYLALGLAFPAGMGLGDVKWAIVLGAYLGWLSWPASVTGTLIAFLAAAVVLVAARIAGRRQASIPMVPFMTLGAVAAVLATR
jgi:leader peptidase (prepilin peptidase) / N-methyltransferase